MAKEDINDKRPDNPDDILKKMVLKQGLEKTAGSAVAFGSAMLTEGLTEKGKKKKAVLGAVIFGAGLVVERKSDELAEQAYKGYKKFQELRNEKQGPKN